jgi:hypothetical protein
MKLAMINISTLLPNPDFEILLCSRLVGIHRNKGDN